MKNNKIYDYSIFPHIFICVFSVTSQVTGTILNQLCEKKFNIVVMSL